MLVTLLKITLIIGKQKTQNPVQQLIKKHKLN